MSEYRWVKFRTLHSSGPSRWEYQEFAIDPDTPINDQLDGFLRELNYQHSTDSEHWRGVEGVFEDPPVPYLEQEIERLKESIKWEETAIERYRASIDAVPTYLDLVKE